MKSLRVSLRWLVGGRVVNVYKSISFDEFWHGGGLIFNYKHFATLAITCSSSIAVGEALAIGRAIEMNHINHIFEVNSTRPQVGCDQNVVCAVFK